MTWTFHSSGQFHRVSPCSKHQPLLYHSMSTFVFTSHKSPKVQYVNPNKTIHTANSLRPAPDSFPSFPFWGSAQLASNKEHFTKLCKTLSTFPTHDPALSNGWSHKHTQTHTHGKESHVLQLISNPHTSAPTDAVCDNKTFKQLLNQLTVDFIQS